MSANNSCRSVLALELISAITRCARGPSSTILHRRSSAELVRVIQFSRSKRCNSVTTVGSSTPSRAAISAWVSASPASYKCISVRHFAWLKPIGFRRSSSFCRHARAVPWSNWLNFSVVSPGDITLQIKLVSMLTNSIPGVCQSFFAGATLKRTISRLL